MKTDRVVEKLRKQHFSLLIFVLLTRKEIVVCSEDDILLCRC